MNKDEMLKEIQLKGFKDTYYRFDMVLPLDFLGRGTNYPICDVENIGVSGTSWEDERCKIPIKHIAGISLIEKTDEYVIVGFILTNEKLGDFVKSMAYRLKSFDFEVKIEESKNGESNTVSRETSA